MHDKAGAYLVEIVDLHTGQSLGRFPLDTGRASFQPVELEAYGGTVAIIDNANRVLLYTYSGERIGRIAGGADALSPDGKRICVEQEPGRWILFDIATAKVLDEMTFPDRTLFVRFSADNRHIVVVTANEMIYVLPAEPSRSVPAS